MSAEPRTLAAYPKPPKRGPKNPKRLRKARKTPRAKLIKMADDLWSGLVKQDGVCEFGKGQAYEEWYPHECFGSLQAMHGISRRYHGTRWNLMNGWAGCQRTHVFYTHRQQEWTRFLIAAWKAAVFEEMWYLALNHLKPDVEAVLERLRDRRSQ